MAAIVALCALPVYSRLSRTGGALLLIVAAGMIDYAAARHPVWPASLSGKPVRCTSVVHQVREGDGARTLTLAIDSIIDFHGVVRPVCAIKVSAMIPSMLPELREGDRLCFSSEILPLESRADLPDEKDITEYLGLVGIQARTTLHPDSVRVSGCDASLYWRLQRYGRRLSRMLLQSPLSDTAGSFMAAVLLGDVSALPSSVRELLTGAGLAHVFALSGLHVGIVAMVVSWLLWPLILFRRRRVRLLAMVGLLWVYALITGLSPSVVRAVIMASALMIAVVVERKSNPFNSLCLAALLILAFDPAALYKMGFQMSFMAVAAILSVGRIIEPLRVRLNPVFFGVLSFVAVSLAAVIATGIISAYHFHVFPVYFILANVGVALFMPVIIIGGILLLICGCFGCDVGLLCRFLDACVNAVCLIAGWVGSLPGATISRIYFSAWLMVPYFAVAGCLCLWARSRRWVWPSAAVMLSGTIVALHLLLRPSYPDAELFVTRERFHTNVLVRHGTRAVLFTTAPVHSRSDVMNSCVDKYAGYFERRGVSGLNDVTDKVAGSGFVMDFCGKLIRIVGSDMDSTCSSCVSYDYLLVCRGFRGDVVDLSRLLPSDTVLLSADINSIRHDRYARELASAGIRYRSLRTGALHLVASDN